MIYEWESAVNSFASSHLEEFYGRLYSQSEMQLVPIGEDNYRMNPCPICGHNDCCTITKIGVNCFSGGCDFRGSHVRAYRLYAGTRLRYRESRIQEEIQKVTKIDPPVMTQKQKEDYKKTRKMQAIWGVAEDFYHKQLMNSKEKFMYKDGKSYTPLEFMLQVRRRSIKTLEDFKVGFTSNRAELNSILRKKGYNDQEIKESKVFCYENLYIFYYYSKDGYVQRFNTKNPFEIRKKKMNPDGTYVLADVIKGYSSGVKTLYFPPDFSFEDDFILVEGEHDLFSIYEQGFHNVCATGGTIRESENNPQLSVLDKVEKNGVKAVIYTCFDNDSAGIKYTDFVNEYFCDRPVKKLNFDVAYNDIDEYYRDNPKSVKIEYLLESAEELVTDKKKIRHYHGGTEWEIADRNIKIIFEIQKRSESAGLVGKISVLTRDEPRPVEMEEGKSLLKANRKYKSLMIDLQCAIDEYYSRNIYSMEFEELVKMYRFSPKQKEIQKRLAELINQDSEVDSKISTIYQILGKGDKTDDLRDEILKIRNSLRTKPQNDETSITKMKLAQSFDMTTKRGYIYFNYHKIDNDDSMKRLPYLLRSDGELIRLDLFKKADENSVLLIDGKFELPCEVPNPICDDENISLKDKWVEKFVDHEIPEEELDPSVLAAKIEEYIRRFYFFSDERYYKVITLYIIMTYYYEAFSSIPYLYLNGEKGSGKSTLASIIDCFAFNSKFAIDISESAMYRSITVEGGTFILDELETLTSRAKSQDSKFAAILKGGYYKEGRIFRTNTDQNNKTEAYSVYGPKVLCNIFGLDDVIEDRCIQIKIPKVLLTADMRKENLQNWKQEHQAEREELTSKLALSALKYFDQVVQISEKAFINTTSSRLSQILLPILTIAKLCDLRENQSAILFSPVKDATEIVGTYEKTFLEFYEDVLSFLKQSVEDGTPEGIIRNVIKEIAKEFLGLVPDNLKEFTVPDLHKYSEPIEWYPEDYTFVISALHIKTFVEEATPENKSYTIRNNKTMMNIFNLRNEDLKRKYVTVTDKTLIQELNNVKRPKMWSYTIHISRVFPELIAEKRKKEEEEKQIVEDVQKEPALSDDDLF